MHIDRLTHAALAIVLGATLGGAGASPPPPRHPFDLPPSAKLSYSISAHQKGISLSGSALIDWRVGDGKYRLSAETRAALFGKILENRSEGTVDGFGLAPAQFYEKRFRKSPWTTSFNRDSKTITFTDGNLSYPIKGGEQDRASVPWQLAGFARAAPDKFTTGSEWTLFVAGRRDAEPWTFRVVGRETIRTRLGPLATLHLMRRAPADAQDQALDIWFAPSHEWYPVRLRFTDNEDDFVEQTLERIDAAE
jgi:hypothetical protein